MVAGGRWEGLEGNGENNEESEETPDTTTRSVLTGQYILPCSKLSGQGWVVLGGEWSGSQRGSGRNKDVSVSLPGT